MRTSTAGIAIQGASREERKAAMGKRKNSRRTTDGGIIHAKAVKMRKMTDEQLVHYVEDREGKARSEGFNQGKMQASGTPQASIEGFVEEISRLKGIGDATMGKIRGLLKERLGEHEDG